MSGSVSPWVLAARPATLRAGVAAGVGGSARAAADGGFRWGAFRGSLCAASSCQVGVNYANDLADAEKGADTADRIGPTRAVASGLLTPDQMRRGIGACFGLAAVAGCYLIWLAGWVILAIGIVSIVAALGYTNGPVPYGYYGLGEVFVFVFFGLVATVGTRYVFDRTAPADAWLSGVSMGLLAAAILVANNVRDIETDQVAGKRTLAVILGRPAARWMYAALVIFAYGMVAGAVAAGVLPPLALLTFVSIPLAVPPVLTIFTQTDGPPLIGVLKATARLQLVVAALLSIGVLIAA